jgi:hypothetical protein
LLCISLLTKDHRIKSCFRQASPVAGGGGGGDGSVVQSGVADEIAELVRRCGIGELTRAELLCANNPTSCVPLALNSIDALRHAHTRGSSPSSCPSPSGQPSAVDLLSHPQLGRRATRHPVTERRERQFARLMSSSSVTNCAKAARRKKKEEITALRNCHPPTGPVTKN